MMKARQLRPLESPRDAVITMLVILCAVAIGYLLNVWIAVTIGIVVALSQGGVKRLMDKHRGNRGAGGR